MGTLETERAESFQASEKAPGQESREAWAQQRKMSPSPRGKVP